MRRRYLCIAVSMFAAGILCFGAPFNLFWIIFGVFMLLGVVLLIKSKKVFLIILSVMFLTGGLYGNYTQNAYKKSPLYEYTQKPCRGKMFVEEIETKSKDYVTVKATVTLVDDKKVNETIRFTIFDLSDIRVNTVIYFDELKFQIPDIQRNRGGFNYNKYLKSKGIYFTASASRSNLRAMGSDGFFILRHLRTLKQQIDYRAQEVFGESYAMQIMPAILVGNDISLSDEINDLFSVAGLTHILVASGMHVAAVIAICAILFYPLRKRRLIYNILSITALLMFGGIVGLQPSIVRAITAYIIYFIARNTLKSADRLTVLFEAMLVILLINPMNIYNLSFLLSFGAVFGIIIFTPHIIRCAGWFFYASSVRTAKYNASRLFDMIITAAAICISAQIGVLPILIWAVNGTAVLSLFVNVVVSLATPLLYAFGVIALITNTQPFVMITEFLCDSLVKGAKITAMIPGNNISLPQSDLITACAILFVVFLILRCKTDWFKKLFEPCVYICVLFALLGCVLSSYIPENKAMVTFLNVNQGDCAIIRIHSNKTIVIDTGTENMCEYELISYLKRAGIGKIDALILSHGDNDHSGGAKILTESVKVEKIITSKFFDPEIEGVLHTALNRGDEFDIGKAHFTVISPDENGKYSDKNDSSLVLRMDFGESSFLFTGDISTEVENTLTNIDADVLKVSHHGSKSSSGENFLKEVSPEFSVVSVDKDNSYGHPDSKVIERLLNLPCQVLRTDKDYTITFVADVNGEFSLTKGL
ncbi:MAG: DNA internalization-related competence protein ComEC/Rec2 [Clostridia bacterium]|nr:DNA internalization-related competence protein ComEC/Rec2 [Clostridia bacterium]